MYRRYVFTSASCALILGISCLFPGNVFAGATAARLHLSVNTVDGEKWSNSAYNCGIVTTTIGSSSLVNKFTVSVVTPKGKIERNVRGVVSAVVSPISSTAACALRSQNTSDSNVLLNARVKIVRGVATFKNLNAAEAGYYVLNFRGAGLVYSGRPILLEVGGTNDASGQGGGSSGPSFHQ